ncbi:sure-like protein [Coprinopsis sp. MPI-PUGE-AT-0042]|nr:sure-like protein [Coprinopsis sp. MPI-PUGE-AT-0042]
MSKLQTLQVLLLASLTLGAKILLTNDDGWAIAQIRSEYALLTAAGHDVVLSAPAIDQSGTGSTTAAPTVVASGCQYSSCPPGSPGVGSDSTNSRFNYVNAYPVDATNYGLSTAGPAHWGPGVGPDLVVAGSNIGNNIDWIVYFSGTVGASARAANLGYPSVAFSGGSGAHVGYSTLTSSPTAASTVAANLYSQLVLQFTNALVTNTKPYLPANITLNVNFAPSTTCSSASAYKFILTRLFADAVSTDVVHCGTNHLPTEAVAIQQGCIATVSVMDARYKIDVSASTQGAVRDKLTSILRCL